MKKKHSFLLCCLALASIATAFSACAGSSDRSSSSRSSSSYSRSSSSTSSSSSSSSSSALPPEPECTHEWSEWEVLSEPTCSVQGMRTHYCLECEETESEKLLLLPHTLSEDFTRCEECGITHTGYYLNYKMNGDAKSAAITGVTNGYGLTLFIPAEDTVQIVAGKPAAKTVPITSIDSNMSFVEVNTLILGQNIKSIGEYAFSNSRSLASVYIPAAFANLPDAALSGCRNLREFIVEEENPNFKAIDGNLYTKDGETLLRYASGNERKTFTVPDGVKKIAPYAFRNARYLQSLVLPEGLTAIGTYAFENAKELTQIEFPSTIRLIEENAFRECGIDVAENYEDGVLYHSNVLVKAQNAPHTYRVKDGTVCIAAGAFNWGNANLMDVTLPASVKGINTYSFGMSQTGATIRFEGNVEEVAERAFFHSSGVEEIHFSENVTEWNTGIMDGFLNLKTIYFDGTMSDYCKMEMPILPTDCVENVCVNGVALAEMEEVTLDDTATVINAHSFVGTPLRKLTISGSVQTIDTRALENLESLEQIVYTGAIDKWLAIESDYAAIYAAAPVSFSAAQGNELRIPDGVEEIKSWAFKDQPYQSLVLPQSLLAVEENAFAGCENLASVNYLDGVEGWCTVDTDYAFLARAALLFNGTQVAGTLEIPGSLETVKAGTFRNQANITELQFGETLTKIEAGAFADCLGIEKICYAGSVEGWCEIDTDYAFLERAELYFGAEKLQGKLTIPQTITQVRDNTFQNQTSLTEIVLPEELEVLGAEAFKGCSNVETATTPVRFAQTIGSLPVRALTLLGAEETEVEDSAFLEQTLLETVTLQGNFKSVGASAFEGCSSLQTLTLSGTIESVGEKAFKGCVMLEDVDLQGALEIGANAFENCSSIVEVAFGEGLSSLGVEAFKGCEKLTSLTMLSGSIGDSAFRDCAALTTASLTGISAIGERAFMGCTSLTGTDVDGSVTIGVSAFENCVSLTELVQKNPTVVAVGQYSGCTGIAEACFASNCTTLGAEAFKNCVGLKKVVLDRCTVRNAGVNVFENCYRLVEVRYKNNASMQNVNQTLLLTYAASVITDNDTAEYITENDCLILKITKESGTVYQSLISYLGTAETVSTADGLTAIQPFAFEGKTCIKTLYVGHTSSNIYPYAFKGCTQITNLTVSSAIAGWRIHEKAFEDLHMVSVLSAPAEVASVIDVSNIEELSLTDGTLSTVAFKGHTKLRKLTIKDCSKICASAFEGCANVTELSVESYEVGENAFKNCTGITSLEVRTNTLGAGAFYGCTALSSAQIEYWSAPGTICDSAFEECTMLSSVEFIRIGTIGSRAFAGCAIVEVELCDQITSFGEEVFSNNLKTATMCADVAALSPDFLQNLETVTITGGTLKESQFENYDNLKNATLLQGTVLGVSTFKYCNSLTDVSLYQSIDTIPDYAFYGCSSLTALVMPMNLKTIGVEAFRLSGLKKVSIGDRLETMGTGAFKGLECLTEITIESAELIVIPDEAFKGTSIETFTIPSGVFKISTLAFAECKKLTSISIPSTVSVLSPQAFENCTRLKTAEINCESVGMNAFNYCSSLQTITLGAEVIGKGAFTGCNALSEATFPSGTYWWTMKSGSRYQRVDVSTPENGAGVLKGINLEYPISSRTTM